MRRMKKLFAVVLAVLTMSMAFAGCSSEETYISFDEVYNQLTSSIDFSASKMQKQTEAALNNYYYIDPATLEDYAIYMADYATGNADEIAMFQVKESDQMTTVKSLINDRISDLKVAMRTTNRRKCRRSRAPSSRKRATISYTYIYWTTKRLRKCWTSFSAKQKEHAKRNLLREGSFFV